MCQHRDRYSTPGEYAARDEVHMSEPDTLGGGEFLSAGTVSGLPCPAAKRWQLRIEQTSTSRYNVKHADLSDMQLDHEVEMVNLRKR